jgi:hypothetical protein
LLISFTSKAVHRIAGRKYLDLALWVAARLAFLTGVAKPGPNPPYNSLY